MINMFSLILPSSLLPFLEPVALLASLTTSNPFHSNTSTSQSSELAVLDELSKVSVSLSSVSLLSDSESLKYFIVKESKKS